MKLIELILDETMALTGIDAISLVEHPAIEEDFIALNSKRVEFATQSEEKRILMGAALVPNKPIYRVNGEEEFYVYFSVRTPSARQVRCSFKRPSRTTLHLNTR
jgi:hypothetical protein